ncbi:cysteine-rich receptor-like protein kinase 25 isoform X1 [Senna tora]|uniref:Cysteine-rich receptor-like protein kinase 25 isoform X1 n=1 Tax=Senna tora TaxID=362788 RepID=A0A834X863_9FABA|nr:cysteine-rich receptor-like protein kinase 25 isoform X1 [Senna tora]
MTLASLQFIFFFHFLLFLQYSATDIQAQAPDYYLNHSCSTTKTFTSDSPYYSNLKTLLSSLSSHATGADEFYNATVHGGADDTIYGLFLCRGDVTPQICKNCLQMAIHKIASRCFYSKEAIVWYHECLVRYSNHSFFSTVEESPSLWRVYNTSVPYSLEQGSVGWVLANTLNAAMAEAADGVAAGEKKFATRTGKVWGDSNEKVYTLVQCSPDLRSEDCKKCLGDMMKDIRMCCLGKDGGMVLNPSCSMMFGSQMFYRDVGTVRARGPPHPSLADAGKAGEEGEKKVNYSRTIIMVISPVVVSVMLYYFAIYLLRRKARKRYAILKENFGTECTTLESLQFDLATIEAATNGFSYENRIGQGGFGEVYKAWRHWRDEKALEIMDPNLGESFCETEVSKCIQIALLCVQENAEDRPHMSRVVSYLSNLSVELPRPHEPAFYVHGRMDPNVVTIESNSGQSTNTHIPSSVNEMSITISFPR